MPCDRVANVRSVWPIEPGVLKLRPVSCDETHSTKQTERAPQPFAGADAEPTSVFRTA
jgi:hypothetical protein